jgi:hypothetical protein
VDLLAAIMMLWLAGVALLILWATRSDRALVGLCVLVFGALLAVVVVAVVNPICYGPNAASCLEERRGDD